MTVLLIVLAVILVLPLLFLAATMILPPKNLKGTNIPDEPTATSEHAKRLGNSWFRKSSSGLWELYVEGKPFERGVIIGRLTRDLIRLQEGVFFREVSKMVHPAAYLYILKLLVAFVNRRLDKHIGKEYCAEIYGISLAAPKEFGHIGPAYQRYLNYHAAHDIGHTLQSFHLVACTAFSVKGERTHDGKILTGRNFDFYVGDDFSREKIVFFCKPDQGHRFAAITWGGMIGCTSGMNEHGLSVTVNGSNAEFPNRSATPVSILIREVLQYASNIEEAFEIIKNKRIFVSESLLISSAFDRRTVIAEKSKSHTVLFEPPGDQIICTNHFQSEALRDDAANRKYMAESPSLYRYQRVEELLSRRTVLDERAVASVLRDKRGLADIETGMGNEKNVDQLLAHHSIIFKPEDRIFWVSCGPYAEGAYQAYDLKKIFSLGSGADESAEIVTQELTIPPDPFLSSPEYQQFLTYKALLAEFMSGSIVEGDALQKAAQLTGSNPEMFLAYSALGDYFSQQKDWSRAIRYYETGLQKHIPNLNEARHMEKQLQKAKQKIRYRVDDKRPGRNGLASEDRRELAVMERMKALSCCVLIPTYNNDQTLARVIREVSRYCEDIIVVNDGSTDRTPQILEETGGIEVLTFPRNRGKGIALKRGLKYARHRGFHYAITIDSDGQHMAEDIVRFVDKIERHPGCVIIGARNMSVDNVPGKSTFGRKFSNFWFRFETGKKVPDTQSGYRLYPLVPVSRMHYFTGRYEFEIEVLVRCAWQGIRITSVPVKVWYAPREERVSHFRPFYDFTRVSLLNTLLVIISLLMVRPFKFLSALNRKNIRVFFTRHVLNPDESNARKTLSVMVGVFIGIIPIWGWQIAAAIVVSVLFRLNKMMTVVASNISIPPMIPVIIYGSYLIGGLFMPAEAVSLEYNSGISLEYVSQNFLQYLIGSFALAIAASLVFGLITWVLLVIFRKRTEEALLMNNEMKG